MTDLEILAQWHDYEVKSADTYARADVHRDAAATIRAAMAENARLREALPLIECIARWERENGTIAAIVPAEYRGFCERISCAARRGSARAALNQKGPDHD